MKIANVFLLLCSLVCASLENVANESDVTSMIQMQSGDGLPTPYRRILAIIDMGNDYGKESRMAAATAYIKSQIEGNTYDGIIVTLDSLQGAGFAEAGTEGMRLLEPLRTAINSVTGAGGDGDIITDIPNKIMVVTKKTDNAASLKVAAGKASVHQFPHVSLETSVSYDSKDMVGIDANYDLGYGPLPVQMLNAGWHPHNTQVTVTGVQLNRCVFKTSLGLKQIGYDVTIDMNGCAGGKEENWNPSSDPSTWNTGPGTVPTWECVPSLSAELKNKAINSIINAYTGGPDPPQVEDYARVFGVNTVNTQAAMEVKRGAPGLDLGGGGDAVAID